MSDELKHGSVGTELTQAEWEGIGTHVFESQATGDLLYASTSSQLRRLAISGTSTHILSISGGVPVWAAPAAAAAGSLTGSTLASGVTASSLTSVGTIATGVWQGTDVGVAYGGTGVSTLLTNAVLTGNGASAIQAETTLLFASNQLIPTASAHDATGTVLTVSAGSTTAGTTNNIAGGALTLQGGQGKGSGAGGDIIFQTANAGGSGSSLNALATALTLSDDLSATFAGNVDLNSSGTLLNVGASGNDWTATEITHEGSLKLTEGGAAKSLQHIYPNNTQGVSTSATLISNSGNTAGLVIVTGAKDDDAGKKFCDLVLTNSGTAAPSVLHSFDQLGAPAARTYTTSGGNLMLAMASDTYDINLLGFQAASPL